nr:ROK family protein [Mangrovibacterium marinum]
MGGTTIKVGRVGNEKIEEIAVSPTPKAYDAMVVVDAIVETISKVVTYNTSAIGIGIPSIVDVEKGIVYDVMNIPAWKEVPIKSLLEEKLNLPVFVNNDANCFAIGEKIYGEGKDFQHFVGVTLGTGLGAGIIQNGRLLKDANCGSGEFCIVPYLNSDYEHYCSGMYFQKRGHSGQEFYEKAKEGDPSSLKVFNDFGFHIGQLVKLVMATVDPQMIVFGGSVAKTFPFFKDAMRMAITDFPYSKSANKLEIRISEKDDHAIYGAAALCR